jgi:NAD-dependent SIR2 family protein deacetylase
MEEDQAKPEGEKVQAWECVHCLDVFIKPKFRWDYEYEQMTPICPCCKAWL